MIQALEIEYLSDGQAVPGVLYQEKDTRGGARPGVVLCPGRLRELEGVEFIARALAGEGFVVLGIRYRGMDMRSDDRDAIDALSWLSAAAGVDARRLGIVGHSRGAMASIRVAATDKRVKSVVAVQPVADLPRYVRLTRDYSPVRYGALSRGMGATPEEVEANYGPLSCVAVAPRIDVPLLLIAGTMDLHSPIDDSLALCKAVQDAGNPNVHVETLDGVGHFFERMSSGYVFDHVAQLITQRFLKTLAADPAAMSTSTP